MEISKAEKYAIGFDLINYKIEKRTKKLKIVSGSVTSEAET